MRSVLLSLLAGCSFNPSTSGGDALNPPSEGQPPTDACVTFSSEVDTCVLPPGTPLTLGGTLTFDTDTGGLTGANGAVDVKTLTLTSADGVAIEAILATTLTFEPATELRAVGSRPFAIVATGAIAIGTGVVLDVSAGGAGARTVCADGAAPGGDRDGGAAGGGGGGFGGRGGRGGTGNTDGTASESGAGGGGVQSAHPLGGCPGGDGGDDNNDTGGAAGAGGGAIYLVSAQSISLAGESVIDAGGAGGRGGRQSGVFFGDAGGAGGGSGGMILLDAPTITSAGILAANGGGGGEGSGNQQPGNPGLAGERSTARAVGGSGRSSTGSDGGSGGARLDAAGTTVVTAASGGAGGGGGGAGIIRIVSAAPELGAQVSPAVTP